jgi:hypothetical protein
MRQAITTKYIGPRNVRGSRVKATSSSGLSVTIGWDDELDTDANHIAAARALATKLNWSGQWVAGATAAGCVFVNVDRDTFTI